MSFVSRPWREDARCLPATARCPRAEIAPIAAPSRSAWSSAKLIRSPGMRVAFHCTWALLIVLAAPAHAQQVPAAPGATGYTVFLRGMAAGVENVTVVTDANGTTLRSEGR